MADINRSPDQENWLEEPRKLPETLNVLTILTFIGCAIALFGSCYAFLNAQNLYDAAIAAQDKMDQMPAIVKSMQGPDPVGTARRTLDNKLPILVLGLVSTGLCLYGAIQMRQWKKTGFTIYTIGEVLPLLTGYLFIGVAAVSGFRFILGLLFVGLFVILYATQLKHLKK